MNTVRHFTRRRFLKTAAVAGVASAFSRLGVAASPRERPNVLFIGVDDLNDWVGCLRGHPQVKTPNLDRLAARGTLFADAHCQAPLCNPSRSSLLTGLRPSTTGIYGLDPGIRDVARTKHHVTLPQTFTQAGYHTFTCGKIYHDRSIAKADESREFQSWGPARGTKKPPRPFARLPEPRHALMDWGAYPGRDEDTGDYVSATAAIEALKHAPAGRSFFVACGFRLPHVPCYAPPKWFELYPEETLVLPPVLAGDRDDVPRFSWYLDWKVAEPRLHELRERNEWRPLVRAYLASISFMDAQLGRVLGALDASGRAENTLVVFWADHGWHLGEKDVVGKNTLWSRSTHVPLVFAGPGVATGATCSRTVESLDIFPTLLELTGLPARPDLEGHSLTPFFRDPNAPREWPAITTQNQNNHSIRTEDWRYTRYADGSEELYDVRRDPHEWTNLAAQDGCAGKKEELARWLPKVNLPPAPGSASHVLTYDPATKVAVWEGGVIGPDDAIPGGRLYPNPRPVSPLPPQT